MANSLYSKLSKVCHSFYRLYFPHEKIALIIDKYLNEHNCKKIVFVGGLVHVAKLLQEKGYEITFVDYTEEMISEARKLISNVKFVVSDMRELNLNEKQDAVVLIGRILTYMYTDEDVKKTLTAFKNNLNKGGIILMDNYETGKIDVGNYFNGTVEVKENNHIIRRISSMTKKQESPALFNWDCVYEEEINGDKRLYEDKNHILRAFSKEEMKNLIEELNLEFIENATNFEKKSFITVARKL